MAGPKKQYEVDLDELPPYDELVVRLESVGVGKGAARQAAQWAHLERTGVPTGVPSRTAIRYRRHLCAAMGVPVPPRPGRAYEDQAEPLRDAGSADLVVVATVGAAALAVMATVHPTGPALAPVLAWGADNVRSGEVMSPTHELAAAA